MNRSTWSDAFISLIVFVLATTIFPLSSLGNTSTDTSFEDKNVRDRLERGEVVVGLKDVGKTKYVEGRVLINESPDKVWPIMVNPFEFQGKISPRMKAVEVMADQANRSVLKVTLDVVLIPHFTYVVESLYENCESIEFHRVGGMLKDFRGSWVMSPMDGGSKTELIYCMYIDPGFPVPQWIIREGVKNELPKTLIALRQRVSAVSEHPSFKERRTILAALLKFPLRHLPGSINSNNPSDNSAERKHIESTHSANGAKISLAIQ
jgi:hypothetical protein